MASEVTTRDLDVMEIPSFVRGYHDIWDAVVGQVLQLQLSGPDNSEASNTVAVLDEDMVVSYIPSPVSKGFVQVISSWLCLRQTARSWLCIFMANLEELAMFMANLQHQTGKKTCLRPQVSTSYTELATLNIELFNYIGLWCPVHYCR